MKFEANGIPKNHPLRKLFGGVADRALSQASLADQDLLLYLSDLLIHFIHVSNLYKLKDKEGKSLEYLVDMCEGVSEAPRSHKKVHYQQIGDHTLFMLGMFPESLTRGKRTLSHSYLCRYRASELPGCQPTGSRSRCHRGLPEAGRRV